MSWFRRSILSELGIAGLCLAVLSGCLPHFVISTAHLKDNIFDQILKANITNADIKKLENDMYKDLKSNYKTNKSIIDYFVISGGACEAGQFIICTYQNEDGLFLVRPVFGSELFNRRRYTWVFKSKNSTTNSGDFQVSVTAELIIQKTLKR